MKRNLAHRDLIILNILMTLGVLLGDVTCHVTFTPKSSNYLTNCQSIRSGEQKRFLAFHVWNDRLLSTQRKL